MSRPHAFLAATKLAVGSFGGDALDERLRSHLKSLRIRDGERLRFMDGAGTVAEAVATDGKRGLFTIESVRHQKPLTPVIELALAPPRGDDLRDAVAQATEIGVTRLVFLKSARTQALGDAPAERARRVAEAACEQCARPWRLEIEDDWHTLTDLLARPGANVVADEALSELDAERIGFPGAVPRLDQTIRLFIGPEGGWSDDERRQFDGRAASLSLGSLVLRVPTAVVAATHFLRTVYQHGPDAG